MKQPDRSASGCHWIRIGLTVASCALALAASGCSINDEKGRALYGTSAWTENWTGTCDHIDLSEGPIDPAIATTEQYANPFQGAYFDDVGWFYWQEYPYLDCDLYARAEQSALHSDRIASALGEH